MATSDAPAGQFKYAALTTPVELSANAVYYVVSQETNGGGLLVGIKHDPQSYQRGNDQQRGEVGRQRASEPCRIYGNRFWGARATSPGLDPSPSSGAAFIQFADVDGMKNRIDIRWNIFEDSTRRVFSMHTGSVQEGQSMNGRHSIVRNIVYNCAGTGNESPVFYADFDYNEIYLNTVKSATTPLALFQFF